jgi:hypothetical protein
MLKVILYSAIIVFSSSLTFGQNITVITFNKTGYDLDSVSFYNNFLGDIPKDSSVVLSSLNEIVMQGDVPLHRPFGSIDEKMRPLNLLECGTKSMEKYEGVFMFDILIYEIGNEYRLYWRKHE